MSIKLKIEGFEQLLKDIEAAGGTMEKACDSAIRGSAQIMQNELKSEMRSAGIEKDLIDRMPNPEVNSSGNRVSAKVGYKSTQYNSNHLSDYFKAIFINYGTPNRSKHGKIQARGFVKRAKNRARPKIKKQQEEAFKKILKRLKK